MDSQYPSYFNIQNKNQRIFDTTSFYNPFSPDVAQQLCGGQSLQDAYAPGQFRLHSGNPSSRLMAGHGNFSNCNYERLLPNSQNSTRYLGQPSASQFMSAIKDLGDRLAAVQHEIQQLREQ